MPRAKKQSSPWAPDTKRFGIYYDSSDERKKQSWGTEAVFNAVILAFDDRYQGHQTTHLYLMNRDGSNPHVVTPQLDRDVEEPQWAPDGSGIYFLYDDQGDTKLAFYSLDGKVKDLAKNLASGGSSYSGGASFTAAKNGTFAIAYGTPTETSGTDDDF